MCSTGTSHSASRAGSQERSLSEILEHLLCHLFLSAFRKVMVLILPLFELELI